MNKIERATEQQFFSFLPGTVGCWSPSAIGVALSEGLSEKNHAFYIIGREGSLTAQALRENPVMTVNGEKREIREYFSEGLQEAYKDRGLPEITIVGCSPDKLKEFSEEFIQLVEKIDKEEGIEASFHVQQLPIFILVANGIYNQSLIDATAKKLKKKVGEESTRLAMEHIVRGTAYVSAKREGEYADADYRTESHGAVVLTGGATWARERAVRYNQNSTVTFIDGKEDVLQAELQKAYTTLMTNVLALANCYDYRRSQPNIDIPVGRLLYHRLPTADGPAYAEIEGIRDLYIQTGRAFFEVAHALGKFLDYPTWEAFDERRFLRPLREGNRAGDFYRHIPSSIQHIAMGVKAGWQSSDQFPPSEAAVLGPLIAYAKKHGLRETRKNLEGLRDRIVANIEAVYQAYREPQVVDALPGTIETFLGDSRDTSFVKVGSPKAIGLSEEEIRPYIVVGTDPKKDGYIIPMSATVFAYGPEKIPGTVAFITNGAGFTLDFLDQSVAAGVRSGFISDLRLNFEEGKFYLAMKMALAANSRIKTIVINVLSTLTTAKDVALAIERMSGEYPNMQFVVKLEARNQSEGLEILRGLQEQKRKIVFTDSSSQASIENVEPLTQERLLWHVKSFEGTTPDRYYENRYGRMEEELHERLRRSFEKRIKYLLTPEPLSPTTGREIGVLEKKALMSLDAVFGHEFFPTEEGKIFIGKPIVVIYGYGRTSLTQAKLIKKAGTEVVILHPMAVHKIEKGVRKDLEALGIPVMTSQDELRVAIEDNYSYSPPQILGLIYEPYSPGIETRSGVVTYRERIEVAMNALVSLKTDSGLLLRSILIPTEMVPTSTTKILLQLARENDIWFIGPNAPGATRTFEGMTQHVKQGQIPAQVVATGSVLVAGMSGTMLFETLAVLRKNGLGISAALSLGGDKTRGLSARDAVLMAEKDARTKYAVYLGEPGGVAAQELADIMKAGLITKPVIARITGRSLPDNCYVGHAGSVTHGSGYERANIKIEVLEQAGAIIVETPEQIGQVVKYLDLHSELGQIDVFSQNFLQAKQILEEAHALATKAIKTVVKQKKV